MAVLLQDEMRRLHGLLRYEPTAKRIRGVVGPDTLVDSRRALLVWEAGGVVPSYAVPAEDVRADLVPTGTDGVARASGFRRGHGAGEELTIAAAGAQLPAAAFRSDDPALSGVVLLDFAAFDRWAEDEETVEGHPRDPFHRVDARVGSQRVVVDFDGRRLADTTRPVLVYETMLPVRAYIPRDDIDVSLLEPSDRTSICPYKGTASYWSVRDGGPKGRNVAWSYENPLPDAPAIAGLVAFYPERTVITVTE